MENEIYNIGGGVLVEVVKKEKKEPDPLSGNIGLIFWESSYEFKEGTKPKFNIGDYKLIGVREMKYIEEVEMAENMIKSLSLLFELEGGRK